MFSCYFFVQWLGIQFTSVPLCKLWALDVWKDVLFLCMGCVYGYENSFIFVAYKKKLHIHIDRYDYGDERVALGFKVKDSILPCGSEAVPGKIRIYTILMYLQAHTNQSFPIIVNTRVI